MMCVPSVISERLCVCERKKKTKKDKANDDEGEQGQGLKETGDNSVCVSM